MGLHYNRMGVVIVLDAAVGDLLFFFFFFNDTATTEIYTLSLHDALPISCSRGAAGRFRSLTDSS